MDRRQVFLHLNLMQECTGKGSPHIRPMKRLTVCGHEKQFVMEVCRKL
jgi:hypothetical protein